MHNIILIEKYSEKTWLWKNLVTLNKTKFSVSEVIRSYNGFEGEVVFFSHFDLKTLYEYIGIYKELCRTSELFLFHAIDENSKMPKFLELESVFMGYDVGVCDREKTFFSSILNEIIFGNVEELVSCQDQLNENLLFESKDLAQKYINLHDLCSKINKGVEDYEKMHIYEIWKVK